VRSRAYDLFFDRKLSLPVKILLSPAVTAGALWLGTRRGFYETCVFNLFLTFGLAGFALIQLRLHPKLIDVLSLLAGVSLMSAIDFKLLHYAFSPYGVGALLGLTSIAGIALRGIWSAGSEKKRLAVAFIFAVLSVSANAAAGIVHNWTSSFTPKVLDLYLFSFDASMRVQFTFLMGQAYATWHRFGDAGMFVYIGFPVVIALVFAGLLTRDKKEALSAMTAFLVTGPLGVIFYSLYPALGPLYVFKNRFPWAPFAIDQISRLRLEPVELAGFRNSMPSLHVAWVLLAWWYSRGLSAWERAIAMFFVIFTVFATLGSGEHYFIDLVVAFPFALFVYGLTALHIGWSEHPRRMAVLLGLGMTVVWIELLRFGVKVFWISPVIPWMACIATVVASIVCQRRLALFSEKASDNQRAAANAITATAPAPQP
jgi:hypothetical protein